VAAVQRHMCMRSFVTALECCRDFQPLMKT
jgi:hypothetical protein